MKTRLHVGMQSCQPIREHQFEFANPERGMPNMREQSKQQSAPWILTEVN